MYRIFFNIIPKCREFYCFLSVFFTCPENPVQKFGWVVFWDSLPLWYERIFFNINPANNKGTPLWLRGIAADS